MMMNNILASEEMTQRNEDWKTVSGHRLNKMQKINPISDSSTTSTLFEQTTTPNNTISEATTNSTSFKQTTKQNNPIEGVHSYFSFTGVETRAKPTLNRKSPREPSNRLQKQHEAELSSESIPNRKIKVNLPPFKLEFEYQQKPLEIHVLNNLVKYNGQLNVSAAIYSTHPQFQHALLLFANDSLTYETLLDPTSWPQLICGLSFQVTMPNRIPTSYSVLVNQISRNWNIDSIQPLIAARYPSIIQAVRIFRDREPTTRIRLDFRSNNDVQSILQHSNIYIGSISYPAVAYKALVRITRCFRRQQFCHKSINCINEPKCYKCGEQHEYKQNCPNPIKCANCSGQHMAGAPECQIKISYRKNKMQEQNPGPTNHSLNSFYLPSPTKLYSHILKTVAPQVHSATQRKPSVFQQPSKGDAQSSIIIETIKNEINRSHGILLERIMQLELKCETVHEQQAILKSTIETQVLPSMATVSELFADVCQ